MKDSGFSKPELIQYNKLKEKLDCYAAYESDFERVGGKRSDKGFTGDGLRAIKRSYAKEAYAFIKKININLNFQKRKYQFFPSLNQQYEYLSALNEEGLLTEELKLVNRWLDELRKRVEQREPGALARYAELKARALPDLKIIVQEETIMTTSEGEISTSLTSSEQIYEVDSGGGLGGSGGYSTQEILNKLENIKGQLNYAVPGGIGSAQGQKVAALIQKTQSRAQVMAI